MDLAVDLILASSVWVSTARKIHLVMDEILAVSLTSCFSRSRKNSGWNLPRTATESLGLGPSLSMRDLGLVILSRHFPALSPMWKTETPAEVLTWSWPSEAVTDFMVSSGIFRRRSA